MYCPKCGKQIPEESTFCLYCGAKISITKNAPETNSATKKFTLPMWSMILGFASILLNIFTAIPSIIIGFMALKRIKKENLPGRGQALTGIIVSSLIIILTIIAVSMDEEEKTTKNITPQGKQESSSEGIKITGSGILKVMIKNNELPEPIPYYFAIKDNKVTQVKSVEDEREFIEEPIESEIREDDKYIYIEYKTEKTDINLILTVNLKLNKKAIGEWQDSVIKCTGIINGSPAGAQYWDAKIVSYEGL